MPAGKHNFLIEQGSTFDELIIYKDSNQTGIDLTGYTAKMHIRTSTGAATFIKELTELSGITLAANGNITLYISDEDTALMNFKSAVYDLELTPPDGKTFRLLQGKVAFSAEVTR